VSPWGNRPHADDRPHENHYGTEPCPRCGRDVTTNGFGRTSHLRSCLRREIVFEGVKVPPVRGRVIIGNAAFDDPAEKRNS